MVCSERVTADLNEEMGDTFEGTLSQRRPSSLGRGVSQHHGRTQAIQNIPGVSQMSSAYTDTGWAKQRVDHPDCRL